jgi:hypothetical protein
MSDEENPVGCRAGATAGMIPRSDGKQPMDERNPSAEIGYALD